VITRLALTDFRNHEAALIGPEPGFVLLSGPNGAGKTNILEAVSLLAPGRGLRGAALSEMARSGGPGAFGVSARLAATDIGTGTEASAPERRKVRINGAPVAVNSLSEWLSVLWLTPAMDRLFSGSAGERRRFLDRLVLALEPSHAHHSPRYDAAMRARNRLLAEERWDEDWLDALEGQMEEHGVEVSRARLKTVIDLTATVQDVVGEEFPASRLFMEKVTPVMLKTRLRASRKVDAAARRSTHGPNAEDLLVYFGDRERPASQCSTGEQKALLLGLILAHAQLVEERRGTAPILLLDEVAAHLDPARRAALFRRLEGRGQVWMTGTEAGLFEGISGASRFHVEGGSVTPA
jgi:DNA replication and repair protein RecF